MTLRMVCAAALVSAIAAIVPPMPAFVWSPNAGMLSSPNTESTSSYSSSDLAALVKFSAGLSAQAPESLRPFFPSSPQDAEVVLVFVHPHLTTAEVSRYSSAFDPLSSGGAFTHLKSAMESSGSALSLPYVYRTSEDDLLHELQGVKGVHVVDAQDAPAYLHGRPSLLHDKTTDVLVIKFGGVSALEGDALREKFSKDDQLMSQILSRTNAATDGDFLAVLTANGPAHSAAAERASVIAAESAHEQLLQTKASLKQKSADSDTWYLYTTPGVLSGLLVVFVLLTILSIGLMAMMALDTPDSFEGEGGYLKGQ